ncbi:3-deoxy-7-phosphoheptulonate synthase [Candidatus Riflebacteria bacterium]
MSSAKKISWHPTSWTSFNTGTSPEWPDVKSLNKAMDFITSRPPLVVCGEVDILLKRLAEVQKGRAFILQGGDCTETFKSGNRNEIKNSLSIFLQMAAIIAFSCGKPILKIASIAGQYSNPLDNGILPQIDSQMQNYQEDITNESKCGNVTGILDPKRMIDVYRNSATTLAFLRSFCTGTLASFAKAHAWNLDFVKERTLGRKYKKIAEKIKHALDFFEAFGMEVAFQPKFQVTEIFTSHEARVLEYEQSLLRKSCGEAWFNTSGHFLWLEPENLLPQSAHVELLRGISNPIGINIGPECSPTQLINCLKILNPEKHAGRLTLILRLGNKYIAKKLPSLLKRVQESGIPVIWLCDPMHGNIEISKEGRKILKMDNVFKELKKFFAIHAEKGTYAGGIHFEMTPENITECFDIPKKIRPINLREKSADGPAPRLNAFQCLKIAFLLVELINRSKKKADISTNNAAVGMGCKNKICIFKTDN